MIGTKDTTGDIKTGHWSGAVGSLALDDRLLLVNLVVEDSPGVYKLSRAQLTDGSLHNFLMT